MDPTFPTVLGGYAEFWRERHRSPATESWKQQARRTDERFFLRNGVRATSGSGTLDRQKRYNLAFFVLGIPVVGVLSHFSFVGKHVVNRNAFDAHDRFRLRCHGNFTVKCFAKYCFDVLVPCSWNERNIRIAYLRLKIGGINSR